MNEGALPHWGAVVPKTIINLNIYRIPTIYVEVYAVQAE
jgi:hypothetical protein